MADIEIIPIGQKEYITRQHAARYLNCSWRRLEMYIDLDLLQLERIGSRKFIEWTALQKFARDYLKREATT